MAVQQTQMLPPQYVEDLQKDYGKQLTATTAAPLDTSKFAPKVAAQDQYQQDVIDATMTEYDTQAAKGLSGIGQLAAQSGNLGGGREGVMRSEYQNKSDMNRALLQSGLLQQGFGLAQKAAQNAWQQQMQMGQGIQAFQGADIASLGQMGATQQAQAQAQLGATQEANRLAAYEPYERLGYQGQGIASIASGMPGQYQSTVTPNPTPLQTALGTGSVLSGMYRDWKEFQ